MAVLPMGTGNVFHLVYDKGTDPYFQMLEKEPGEGQHYLFNPGSG